MNRYLVLITAVVSFAFINISIARAAEDAPEQGAESTPRKVGRPAGLRPPKRTDGERMSRERMDAMRRGRGRESGRTSRAIMQEQQLAVLGKQYKDKLRKHEAFIGQLNVILKSAQNEEAAETVALLEKLIERQKHTFTASTKNLTKRRDMIREQLTETKKQEKATNRSRGQQPTPVKEVAEKVKKAEKAEKAINADKPKKAKKAEKSVEKTAEPAAEEEGKKKGFWKKLFRK